MTKSEPTIIKSSSSPMSIQGTHNDHDREVLTRCLCLTCLLVLISLMTGCGAVPVHHVPKLGAISPGKMADLHGTQPIEVKAGPCSSEEKAIGSVGLGKVLARYSEWTDATAGAVRTNLLARGATLQAGAPKILTITMTEAEVHSIPIVGISKSKIAFAVMTSDGLNNTFEGSGSSMAPLGAIDGAVEDAIKKLLADSAVEAYLRK